MVNSTIKISWCINRVVALSFLFWFVYKCSCFAFWTPIVGQNLTQYCFFHQKIQHVRWTLRSVHHFSVRFLFYRLGEILGADLSTFRILIWGTRCCWTKISAAFLGSSKNWIFFGCEFTMIGLTESKGRKMYFPG